jgi:hypothetical protein
MLRGTDSEGERRQRGAAKLRRWFPETKEEFLEFWKNREVFVGSNMAQVKSEAASFFSFPPFFT